MPTCPVTCPKVKRELRKALAEGRFTPDGKPVQGYYLPTGDSYGYVSKGGVPGVREDGSGIYGYPDPKYAPGRSPGIRTPEVSHRVIDYDAEWVGDPETFAQAERGSAFRGKTKGTTSVSSRGSRRTPGAYSREPSGYVDHDGRPTKSAPGTRTQGTAGGMSFQDRTTGTGSRYGVVPEGTQTPGMKATVNRGQTPGRGHPEAYKEAETSVSVSYADAEASYYPAVTTFGVGSDPRYLTDTGQQTPGRGGAHKGVQPDGSRGGYPDRTTTGVQPDGSGGGYPDRTTTAVQPDGSGGGYPDRTTTGVQSDGSRGGHPDRTTTGVQPDGSIRGVQPQGSVRGYQPDGSNRGYHPDGPIRRMQRDDSFRGQPGDPGREGQVDGRSSRGTAAYGTGADGRAARGRAAHGTGAEGRAARGMRSTGSASSRSYAQEVYNSLPHDSCESSCYLQRKRERTVRNMEQRQQDVDRYYLTKGSRYFDDVCTCSLSCMFHCLKRDRFVRSILTSTAVFALGVKVCEEMKNWFLTTAFA